MRSVVMLMGGCIPPLGECLAVFLRQAGGAAARVAILPTACANPQVVHAYARGLTTLGLHYPPFILPIWERAQAEDRTLVRILGQVSGLLILGGDVVRFLKVVQGTRLHHALQQAVTAGMVIAGISAGAAAMGSLVLGSWGRLHPQGKWLSGLGLLPCMVVVPHFHQRGRHRVLMHLLTQNPIGVGVGVDEATAALINAEGIHSIGSGLVTLMIAGFLPSPPSGKLSPWAIHLRAGQSLTWNALSLVSAEVEGQGTRRYLPPVTGAADVMFHFFQQ